MGHDDSGTLARLKAHRLDLIDAKIAEYVGRIVKTTGDGLLLEFPSVVDAVRCAVDVQRGMAERNAGVSPDQRIDFRIGINVGDIIIDGDDIYGDGVNVAARVQALAEPGGICVSKVVRDQVLDKLSFTFEDLGAQQVKNIARPVEIYRIDLAGAGAGATRKMRLPKVSQRMWLGTGAVVAAGAMATIWLLAPFRVPGPSVSAPPMSIAVLPLAVTGEGIDARELGNRLTQDVISTLARGKRSARVSPYALISDYKSGAVDPRSLGGALKVRYVAEGDIRMTGTGATVVTRLYDAATAAQLATDTSQVTEMDSTARNEQVIERAALQIRKALGSAERVHARIARADTDLDQLAHTSLVLQTGNYSPSAVREALKLVDDVLRRDPTNVSALVRRFWLLNDLYEDDLHADRDWLVKEMDSAASRAVLFDPRDAEAWHSRAIAFGWQGRWTEAEEALAEARRLDPSNPEYVEQRTHLLLITGHLDGVKSIVDEVVKRTGSYSDREMRDLCWLNVASGNDVAAVPFCAKAAALSDWWSDEMFLTAAYAQAGQIDKAKEAAVRLVRLQPDITIDLLRKRRYSTHPDYRRWEEAQLFEGLRKAGIPEG
jgi:TolB-like protein